MSVYLLYYLFAKSNNGYIDFIYEGHMKNRDFENSDH